MRTSTYQLAFIWHETRNHVMGSWTLAGCGWLRDQVAEARPLQKGIPVQMQITPALHRIISVPVHIWHIVRWMFSGMTRSTSHLTRNGEPFNNLCFIALYLHYMKREQMSPRRHEIRPWDNSSLFNADGSYYIKCLRLWCVHPFTLYSCISVGRPLHEQCTMLLVWFPGSIKCNASCLVCTNV